MSDEVRDTETIRHIYGLAFVDETSSEGARRRASAGRAEFDRWLAQHDREVASKALRDAADTWGAEPDLVGDSFADARNWLRDRADVLAAQS